jgi:hypothetical protein
MCCAGTAAISILGMAPRDPVGNDFNDPCPSVSKPRICPKSIHVAATARKKRLGAATRAVASGSGPEFDRHASGAMSKPRALGKPTDELCQSSLAPADARAAQGSSNYRRRDHWTGHRLLPQERNSRALRISALPANDKLPDQADPFRGITTPRDVF